MFVPSINRGSSDFDLRHQFNANFVYELPFGKGKMLLKSAPKWLDEITGGWQVSGLVRVQSGLPISMGGFGNFNTNYWNSSPGVLNGAMPETGVFTDNNGVPSLFKSTTAASQFTDAPPGGAPFRAIARLPWQKNTDLTVTKNFRLPWEHHLLQLRVDAFNVFNNVNFTTNNSTTGGYSLSLSSPNTFGEFSKAADARVLQLALRYSF